MGDRFLFPERGEGLRIIRWRDGPSSRTKKLFVEETPFLLEGSSGLDIFTLTALMVQEKKHTQGKVVVATKGKEDGKGLSWPF